MEYILPALIGGLIGLYVGVTAYRGAYAFNFIYGAAIYGVPLYFVMLSSKGFPLVTLGFALTANATGYARELVEPWNTPRILRNKFLMLATNMALLIDFVLMCYFGYKIFSDYSWIGIAHFVFAISMVTILSRGTPSLIIVGLLRGGLTPILSAIVGVVIYVNV